MKATNNFIKSMEENNKQMQGSRSISGGISNNANNNNNNTNNNNNNNMEKKNNTNMAGFTISSDNYPFYLTFTSEQVIALAEDMLSTLESEIREFLADAEDAGAEDEQAMSLSNYVGTYWQAYLDGNSPNPNPMPYLCDQIFTSPFVYFDMWGILQVMLCSTKYGKISCSQALEVWSEISGKIMEILSEPMNKKVA